MSLERQVLGHSPPEYDPDAGVRTSANVLLTMLQVNVAAAVPGSS